MTLLDFIALHKIMTVNFMWQNNFFEPLAKMGMENGVWKL